MNRDNEFDAWEHYEEEDGFIKIRAPKIKKIKKDREYIPNKKKKKNNGRN